MQSPAKLPFHKLFKVIHASQFPMATDRDFLYDIVRWLIRNGRILHATCVYDIYHTAHEQTRQMMFSYFKLFNIPMTKIDSALLQLYDVVGMDSYRYFQQDQQDLQDTRQDKKPAEGEIEEPFENEADEIKDDDYDNDEDEGDDDEDEDDQDDDDDYEEEEDDDYEEEEDDDYEEEEDDDYEEEEEELMEVCLDTQEIVRNIRALQDCQTRHMGWMVGMLCVSMTANLWAFYRAYQQDFSNLSHSIWNALETWIGE